MDDTLLVELHISSLDKSGFPKLLNNSKGFKLGDRSRSTLIFSISLSAISCRFKNCMISNLVSFLNPSIPRFLIFSRLIGSLSASKMAYSFLSGANASHSSKKDNFPSASAS